MPHAQRGRTGRVLPVTERPIMLFRGFELAHRTASSKGLLPNRDLLAGGGAGVWRCSPLGSRPGRAVQSRRCWDENAIEQPALPYHVTIPLPGRHKAWTCGTPLMYELCGNAVNNGTRKSTDEMGSFRNEHAVLPYLPPTTALYICCARCGAIVTVVCRVCPLAPGLRCGRGGGHGRTVAGILGVRRPARPSAGNRPAMCRSRGGPAPAGGGAASGWFPGFRG